MSERGLLFMINNIISDKGIIEREKRIFEQIAFSVLIISCIYIFNIKAP